MPFPEGSGSNRPRVLVTGSGNVTGLNVVRALVADGGIDVIGCDLEPWNPANQYCSNDTVPKASSHEYIPRILDLVGTHRIGAIIPSNDHEVRALAEHLDELTAAGAMLNASCANQLAFLDKGETVRLFRERGVRTPGEAAIDGSVLPLVVRKRRMGDGAKFVHIVRTPFELEAVSRDHADRLIATEFIEGDEFTVDILSDFDAQVLAVVPRLRRVVRHGIVHFAEVVPDPAVLESAAALARAVGLTGINCVQCIRRHDECHYFEVNPRPGSGIDLTVAAGINMPALWARLAHGEAVTIGTPEWGLKLIRTYDGYFFR